MDGEMQRAVRLYLDGPRLRTSAGVASGGHSTKALIPAAQYLRMSTHQQEYSLENQRAALASYASERGIQIIRTYSDAGRSGLDLKHRAGLRDLLHDVLNGTAPFREILVYDVSRWGRFQDSDEAACYEFLCRSSGVSVRYCAESFGAASSLPDVLLKAMSRALAGEFSRDLGRAEFDGKSRILKSGFWVGGRAPFGLRRLVLSPDARRQQVLERGEAKTLRTDRIILIRGPIREVRCVRSMFAMLLKKNWGASKIARALNASSENTERSWNSESVRNVLKNPVYMGCPVWGRTSQKFQAHPTPVMQEKWIVGPRVFPAIVQEQHFRQAQSRLKKLGAERVWSTERLLLRLRWLLASKGKLTTRLIEDTPQMPSVRLICSRFGSLRNVYGLVGYELPLLQGVRADTAYRTRNVLEAVAQRVQSASKGRVEILHLPRKRPELLLDGRITVSISISPAVRTPRGELRWRLSNHPNPGDFGLVCRLDATNRTIRSSHLFARRDCQSWNRLKDNDPWLRTGVEIKSWDRFCDAVHGLRSPQCQSAGRWAASSS